MKPLCIYHSNCADGFGAAWVVWKHFKGEVDFFPGVYQRPPPDARGRHVIFVDFCYKSDVMIKLSETTRSILVLDHHKTAMEDMRVTTPEDEDRYIFSVPVEASFSTYTGDFESPLRNSRDIWVLFDMERSGAGITWDFFNPGQPRPKLIDHIEDRDLWRWALPFTREIQAAVFSYPYDFNIWDALMQSEEAVLDELRMEGVGIERKHHKDIAELIEVVTRPMRIRIPNPALAYDYVVVPVANLPYTLTSDAGHLLCERDWNGKRWNVEPKFHPFAACYWDIPEGRVFSLRSRADGADVGAIAVLHGGGGHAHAAGFRVPYDRLYEFEP